MQVLASFSESFKICGHLDRVTLSTNQKVKLAKAFQDKSPITLHLSKGELIDGYDLMITKTQLKKIQKAMALGVGVDIKICEIQMRHVVRHGGHLFSTLLSLGVRLLPVIAKEVLQALTTCAIGSLDGLAMDKIAKRGKGKTGGFMIPVDRINQLIPYQNLFTYCQNNKLMEALKQKIPFVIKLTKKQSGRFLSALLASIGASLLLNALAGKGMQITI